MRLMQTSHLTGNLGAAREERRNHILITNRRDSLKRDRRISAKKFHGVNDHIFQLAFRTSGM